MFENIEFCMPKGTDPEKIATIVHIKQWRGARGQQIEENEPYDGWKLPAETPRFVGFGLAVIQELGAPQGTGVQVPYRFALNADTIVDAMEEYVARVEGEAQKAYKQWVAQQTTPKIARPR